MIPEGRVRQARQGGAGQTIGGVSDQQDAKGTYHVALRDVARQDQAQRQAQDGA